MSSDEALSGFGVVRPPGLRPAANNTVVANIAGDGNYPRNTPIEEVLAAIGGLQYQGTWNAATNTPTITSGVGTNGQFYIVSVAGSTTIDGISQWSVGDWIIYTSDTDIWQKVEGGLTNAEINAALGHDLTLGGDLTTTGAFSTAGSFGVTLTATGATSVTLPTSGTLATVAATLQVANNLSDLNSATTARTNLGLGTAATQSTGTFLQVANNLGDLASASTARGNLGLGTAAVLNVGTGANNIVQLTAGGILPAVDGSQLTNLPAAGGALLAANNLSDLTNVPTARTNLGLGTAATQATSAFLQPSNNLSDVASASTSRTNLGLGTASTQADTFFLQVANNLNDLNSAATARTNLGLGTAATQATSAFLQPGNNLSDVSNASTARTNLGLGAAATQALTAFLQPTNNLSDVSSAATSRVNLNIDKYTGRGDADYTIQTTDVVVGLTATLTTTRTWTLPAANGVNAGQKITIIDLASGVSSTNFITIARAGADTVNGTTSVNFTVPYGTMTLTSNGVSAWEATKVGIEQGGTGATTASAARTSLGLAIGTDVQAYDADLAAIAALSSSGLISRTGAGTAAARTLTGPAAGITVSNGDGVSGNPTLALSDDLAALEGLGSTGFAARTGSNAWAQRTITGTASEITVSDGNGVSGNPTLSMHADYGKGRWVLISSASPSASSTVDFTGFDANKYDQYEVRFWFTPSVSDYLSVRTSTDGGSSYDSGASNYLSMYMARDSSGYPLVQTAQDTAGSFHAYSIEASTNFPARGSLFIYEPNDAVYSRMDTDITYFTGSSYTVQWRTIGAIWRQSAGDVNAIRFLLYNGATITGSFKFYGRRK